MPLKLRLPQSGEEIAVDADPETMVTLIEAIEEHDPGLADALDLGVRGESEIVQLSIQDTATVSTAARLLQEQRGIDDPALEELTEL